MQRSVQEPRADNLAVANLRSYPLSCIAASQDVSAKCLSQHRIMLSVGIELTTL